MREYLAFLISVCFFFSCSSRSQEDRAMLKEAYELQTEVIKIIKDLKSISSFESQEEKDSIEDILHEIEEALFAIPGYDLTLPGHEGHDHGHNRVKLTTEEILEIQSELLKEVTNLTSTYQTNN